MQRLLMALPILMLVATPASAATLTTLWVVTKYGGIVLGIVLILFVAMRKRPREETKIEVPSLPETPMFSETLLTMMFHTARLSGDISQNTLQVLLRSYKHLTGNTVSQKMITAKYAQTTEADELLGIVAPFSRIERDTIMRACVDVAAADGALTSAEHDFLMALSTALGHDAAVFRDQIRMALHTDRPRTIVPTAMPA
ncbi:TerB family tellurite resistance protein [Loktanella sp. F6476L]|uniref:TerB family tellurite resistance protein n=1 Tax=Loktanella sp. F6476L TaxID=2926405 RepID=UPI001FF1F221|nr:TerB family tellurite resistance protein [Loktanella sp. F6476L]MCK0120248.1 TerB family tellurite resistance protein [Loktanella sp. F6476L]